MTVQELIAGLAGAARRLPQGLATPVQVGLLLERSAPGGSLGASSVVVIEPELARGWCDCTRGARCERVSLLVYGIAGAPGAVPACPRQQGGGR